MKTNCILDILLIYSLLYKLYNQLNNENNYKLLFLKKVGSIYLYNNPKDSKTKIGYINSKDSNKIIGYKCAELYDAKGNSKKHHKCILFIGNKDFHKKKLYKILYFRSGVDTESFSISPNGKFLIVGEGFSGTITRNLYCFNKKSLNITISNSNYVRKCSGWYLPTTILWLINLKTKEKYLLTIHPIIINKFIRYISESYQDCVHKHNCYNHCKDGISLYDYPWDKTTGPFIPSPFILRIDSKILWSYDGTKVVFRATKTGIGYKPFIHKIIFIDIKKFLKGLKNMKREKELYNIEKIKKKPPLSCFLAILSTNYLKYSIPELKYLDLDENFQPLFWYSNKKIAFRYKNKFIMLFDLKSLIDTSK